MLVDRRRPCAVITFLNCSSFWASLLLFGGKKIPNWQKASEGIKNFKHVLKDDEAKPEGRHKAWFRRTQL